MVSSKIKVEESNLEDLILLGEDKKIPIHIEFPNGKNTIQAKALIKQLTLKEMDKIKMNQDNPWEMGRDILRIALLKQNGENFTDEELSVLPMGVVTEISEAIMETSGMKTDRELRNF